MSIVLSIVSIVHIQFYITKNSILLSKETEKRREEIWRKVADEATHSYVTTNGVIKMDNESICVVGTRP